MSNESLQEPLQFIVNGNLEGVKAWLEKGGDLLGRFNNQETLLHKASFSGQVPIIRYLLEQGLPISVSDNNGYMPLHEAARNGQFEAVRYLLSAGANPEPAVTGGKTAEDLAADKGAGPLVELLKVARQKPFWVRSDAEEVSHVTYKQGIGYRLTEIFNFRAETYLLVARNLQAGAESIVLKTFDELRGSPLVEEARQEFQRMGGALPDTTAGFDKPKPRSAAGLKT